MNFDNPVGIIFTDFDGTLFDSTRTIVPENYKALKEAGRQGYIRVIATGRSLYSFRRVAKSLEKNIEDYIDFIIFSSGAGTLKCLPGMFMQDKNPSKETLIQAQGLNSDNAFSAAELLFQNGYDFMIHKKIPENHCFTYIKTKDALNPDFLKRISMYNDFASPLKPSKTESALDAIKRICLAEASQLIAIIPPDIHPDMEIFSMELLDYIRLKLPDCSVIRTTSPIDHNSLWIEIFNQDVSKSKAAVGLAERFGLEASNCLAVGNDFNDEDMLSWAGLGMTVAEAPEIMKKEFPSAGPSTEGAISKAIHFFMKSNNENNYSL